MLVQAAHRQKLFGKLDCRITSGDQACTMRSPIHQAYGLLVRPSTTSLHYTQPLYDVTIKGSLLDGVPKLSVVLLQPLPCTRKQPGTGRCPCGVCPPGLSTEAHEDGQQPEKARW